MCTEHEKMLNGIIFRKVNNYKKYYFFIYEMVKYSK